MNFGIDVQELITICLLAIALGMDAFSVGIGLGAIRIRYRQIAYVCVLIGFFHMMMPYLGMLAGKWMLTSFAPISTWVAGTTLILLGMNILFSSLITKEERIYKMGGWSLFVFSIVVSTDSLSVGFTLGMFQTPVYYVITIFGVTAAALIVLGITIGKFAKSQIGNFGEIFGGIVLLGVGVKLLLG